MKRPSSYWIRGLKEFFASTSVRSGLPGSLEASGCREGWVQCEMFRFFRSRTDAFFVNEEPLVGRTKADFSAYSHEADDAELWMIGELKVLGTAGYQRKSLGLPVPKLKEGATRVLLTPPETASGWGLVPDYCRLRDFAGDPSVPRLLVLVLDTRSEEANALGKVLLAADFAQPAVVLHETKDFIAKCWTVPAKRS